MKYPVHVYGGNRPCWVQKWPLKSDLMTRISTTTPLNEFCDQNFWKQKSDRSSQCTVRFDMTVAIPGKNYKTRHCRTNIILKGHYIASISPLTGFYFTVKFSPFKGVPMLDSGSEYGDETHTIVFVTLQNPGSASRNFPVGLVRDFRPFWRFFGSSPNTANYRPIRLEPCSQKYFFRIHTNQGHKFSLHVSVFMFLCTRWLIFQTAVLLLDPSRTHVILVWRFFQYDIRIQRQKLYLYA